MLPTRELLGTDVVTSAVGFGCAGLFKIPHRNIRRSVLDAAYDAGIRHFDVAPMYGLGRAEAELSSFLKRHRNDITITTKFGITPTIAGKGVGLLQGPIRAFLDKRPDMTETLKIAADGPHSGSFGRLLYSCPGYDKNSAEYSLEKSLRALGVDYVDVFLLHDPVGGLRNTSELAEYLDEKRREGRIRAWGITSRLSQLPVVIETLRRAEVIQFRDDVFGQPLNADKIFPTARITFGALAHALPALRRFIANTPNASEMWSERLGKDLTAESSLAKLLLSIALRRNPSGPVLFTTSKPQRIRVAAEAALHSTTMPDALVATFSDLVAAARLASAEMIRTP